MKKTSTITLFLYCYNSKVSIIFTFTFVFLMTYNRSQNFYTQKNLCSRREDANLKSDEKMHLIVCANVCTQFDRRNQRQRKY